MIELTRTNDPVLLSWLVNQLEQAGIKAMVFDTHTSILEGSIAAIPRRVMVLEEHETEARQILAQAPAYGQDVETISDESGSENWLPDPVKS